MSSDPTDLLANPRYDESQRILASAGSGVVLSYPTYRAFLRAAEAANLPSPYRSEAEFTRAREAELQRFVEQPCHEVMREVWRQGGQPFSSNYFGAGRRGVDYIDQNGREAFSPVVDVNEQDTAKAAVDRSQENNSNMPAWAREEMARRGLDPKRSFNDVDLRNPSVIEGIKMDPTLSPEQRERVLQTGSSRELPNGEAALGFGASSFADNSGYRPKFLHATMLDAKNPRQLRVAAITPSGELLTNPDARIHAQLTSDPAASLGFITSAGVYLNREQASAYRAGQEPLVVAARAETGEVITIPGAQVHSDLPAAWDSKLGYLTPDGRFLDVDQARAQSTGSEWGPPAYLQPPRPFLESLKTVEDALRYRTERQTAYRQLLQDQIGITAKQAERLDQLVARDANTNAFEKSLTPEQRTRMNRFFDGPYNIRNGPFEDWIRESTRNPETLLETRSRTELAEVVVDELANLKIAPQLEASDRFAYPVVALLRLKEIGGSWRNVSAALTEKLVSMRAGNDAQELYEAYGRNVRSFAQHVGIVLPLECGAERESPGPSKPHAIDELLVKAEKWRDAWKVGDVVQRAKIADELEAAVNQRPGSGLTKVPLQTALREFVTDNGTLAKIEQRLATHTAAVSLQVQHGFNHARGVRGHER